MEKEEKTISCAMLGHGPNEEKILLLFHIEEKWTEISKELQIKLVWPMCAISTFNIIALLSISIISYFGTLRTCT